MIRWMLSVALATTLAGQAGAQDKRLVTRAFDPDQVIRLDGKLNVQTAISFDADEKIENVAVGDSENWQITPNRRADLLFVKPLVDNVRTNMTVVTDKRTYFFDLVASPTAKPVYALRLTYAPPVAQEPAVAAPAPSPGQAPAVAAMAPPGAAPAELGRQARAEIRAPAPKSTPQKPPESRKTDSAPAPGPAAAAAPAPAPVPAIVESPALRSVPTSEFEAAFANAVPAKGESEPVPVAAVPQPAPEPVPHPASPWRQTGPEKAERIEVSDDGVNTYLRVRRLGATPPIYSRDSNDALTRLAVTRSKGAVVIAGVPQQIVVGDGRNRVWLVREPALSAPDGEVR